MHVPRVGSSDPFDFPLTNLISLHFVLSRSVIALVMAPPTYSQVSSDPEAFRVSSDAAVSCGTRL